MEYFTYHIKRKEGKLRFLFRGVFVFGLALFLMLSSTGSVILTSALEAHVVEVLAHIKQREGENGGPPPDSLNAPKTVILNEILWMGSENDEGQRRGDDEWLELRNMTDEDIAIGEWVIENARSANEAIVIPTDQRIPAQGYFLISHWPLESDNTRIDVSPDLLVPGISLANNYETNGPLILRDANGDEIDRTPEPEGTQWPEGVNAPGKKWSMERNFAPGDGADKENWHTCDRDLMSTAQLDSMTSRWKENAQDANCGTPGHQNLSKNDPTYPVSSSEEGPAVGRSAGDGGSAGDEKKEAAESLPADAAHQALQAGGDLVAEEKDGEGQGEGGSGEGDEGDEEEDEGSDGADVVDAVDEEEDEEIKTEEAENGEGEEMAEEESLKENEEDGDEADEEEPEPTEELEEGASEDGEA